MPHARTGLCWLAVAVLALAALVSPAAAAEQLNAYSIWPENWARPMLQEFEQATGIKVNFVRFSSGEALARVIAEKNNPKVDVLFGGPVETFAAGIKEGIFEPYKPPAFNALPTRFKQSDGYWTAIADDPLVFMTNAKFLKENNLKAPSSWEDLLNPAYKNMLQMADARTSGTAVTRIFSIIEVNGRNEDKAFDYMKKLRKNVQVYTKSGGGGTLPVGLGQAGGGIFFIVDALDIVWGVLKNDAEERTMVVVRLSNPVGRYAYVSVDGVDPFTQRRIAVVEGRPLGSSVDLTMPRASFADLPRREIHLYASAADWRTGRPGLTVYYLGVPDTTPEFTTEAALETYLARPRSPGR